MFHRSAHKQTLDHGVTETSNSFLHFIHEKQMH